MKNFRELSLMTRDFLRVVRGKDYFHQPQGVGGFFVDSRAYYNDFRGKAGWQGRYEKGVPLLYVAALGRHVAFPIMVLQYGLGSVDRLLLEGDKSCSWNIQCVAQWLTGAVNGAGCLDNFFPEMDPDAAFYSSNSGMAQGEALSFLTRVVQYELVPPRLIEQCAALLRPIFENMIRPVHAGGTSLSVGEDLYFVELCRQDATIILNGWIYALFGILDYARFSNDDRAQLMLKQSFLTLEKDLDQYIMNSGWSYYNNRGRVASPFYHSVHIALLEALAKLFRSEPLEYGRQRLCAGEHFTNRAAFTLRKIKEKLCDTTSYTTSRAA